MCACIAWALHVMCMVVVVVGEFKVPTHMLHTYMRYVGGEPRYCPLNQQGKGIKQTILSAFGVG